ncbi:DNA polymerase IV [Chitinolyticbacter meiyuanensis]|uniref:DNA polymerase IV n=1 Tax=Chitinolyticbacter meiyuanensis TaxID=682798 RepID=UPI0011E5F800|nr:DNA polymerase IV [Chitinolyticbacter meiyuanensis]
MDIARKIIHIDCDCFYAAVEMRDRPELRDLPLAVGGRADQRGVISTCNYVARRYGIHSAMPTSRALRLCPTLTLLPHSFDRYREASRRVHAIFKDYTAHIQPLSLDEAYLDVTGSAHCKGSATLIAEEVRRRIREEVGITASAGIAPNKLLAKIASDWNKPDGQFVIRPQDVADFMPELPIAKLWGIGRVTAERLAQQGLVSCGDAQTWPLERLVSEFGNLGASLYSQCRGIDERPVHNDGVRKSLSVETTYAEDLPDLASCMAALPPLYDDLTARLARHGGTLLPHKAVVKIKYRDFTQTTIECVCQEPRSDVYQALLERAWPRGAKPVRLLGVGVRFAEAPQQQERGSLPLW